jgi:hypothetical protein
MKMLENTIGTTRIEAGKHTLDTAMQRDHDVRFGWSDLAKPLHLPSVLPFVTPDAVRPDAEFTRNA